jgi:hypothetical protein
MGKQSAAEPMGLRVEEGGESECRPVTGRIGVETSPRAKALQTSTRCFNTRESGKTTKEATQMAEQNTDAASNKLDWPERKLSSQEQVRRLQARIVKAQEAGDHAHAPRRVPNTLEVPEPCAGKLARTVLRGGDGDNAAALLYGVREAAQRRPAMCAPESARPATIH